MPTVATDGEEGLLVVVGGDVEHEHVGPAHRRREHAGVSVQAWTQHIFKGRVSRDRQ